MNQGTDHGRLWASDRKRNLVEAAGRVLTRDGVDAIRIPTVAEEAGVTRPVVYKHFANRQAIIIAVLEDFSEALDARFRSVLSDSGESFDASLRGVIIATCDTIEHKGPGPWRLLGSAGPDREVEQVAHEIRDRLLQPWSARIASTTGAPRDEVLALGHVTSAVTRGVLDFWVEGRLSRDRAMQITLRSVGALVREFAPSGIPDEDTAPPLPE